MRTQHGTHLTTMADSELKEINLWLESLHDCVYNQPIFHSFPWTLMMAFLITRLYYPQGRRPVYFCSAAISLNKHWSSSYISRWLYAAALQTLTSVRSYLFWLVFHILNTVYVAQHCVSYKQCGVSCDIRRHFLSCWSCWNHNNELNWDVLVYF